MKLTVWTGLAMDMLVAHDRANYFSWDGMDALLEWYDENDENAEFDIVEICCEWTEYGDDVTLGFDSLINDYGNRLPLQDWLDEKDYTVDEYENDEDLQEEYLHDLINELEIFTTVIRVQNGNIILGEF